MLIEKKFFPELKLRIYTGAKYPACNLSRKWYVEYYLDGERQRVYGNINRYKSIDERIEEGKALAIRTLAKIQKDFNLKQRIIDHVVNRKYNRKKTRQDYESKIRILMGFLAGKKLDQDGMNNFFVYLLHNKHEVTYNKYLTVLKMLFKEMEIIHLLSGIRAIKKAESTPAQYFQRHQAKLLLDRIKGDPDLHLCIQLMFYCFLRPAEIRLLKIGDIFFEDRKILVRKEISKNGKSQFISIPDCFYPEIKRLIFRKPGDFVIENPNKAGYPVSANHFANAHRIILKSFGFDTDRFKMYSWRHTGAVMAAKAGISLKSLQIQMRHHSIDQTDQYLRQMGVMDQDDLKQKMVPMNFEAA